jgi:hypothetical protein
MTSKVEAEKKPYYVTTPIFYVNAGMFKLLRLLLSRIEGGLYDDFI